MEFQLRGPLPALEAFADFMAELGAGGAVFSEAPDSAFDSQMVTAFLPAKKARPEIRDNIRARAKIIKDQYPGSWSELEVTRVEDRDWGEEWKLGLEPIRLDPGIWIVPSFKEVPEEAGHEPMLRLDPGLAFGTGLHPTTRMCIKEIGEAINNGADSVLDIGTGTGILAMAAARFGAGRVLAVDVDPIALSVASENLKANGLLERVELGPGVSDPGTALSGAPFDLIAANLFAESLVRLLPFIERHLAPGGRAILSGIIEERLDILDRAISEAGFVVKDRIEEEKWVTLVV